MTYHKNLSTVFFAIISFGPVILSNLTLIISLSLDFQEKSENSRTIRIFNNTKNLTCIQYLKHMFCNIKFKISIYHQSSFNWNFKW